MWLKKNAYTDLSRTTVQNYFGILVNILIGYWVPAWKLKRSTKQISHPKFYIFDFGVVRGMTGRVPYPPAQEELGPLFGNLFRRTRPMVRRRVQSQFLARGGMGRERGFMFSA